MADVKELINAAIVSKAEKFKGIKAQVESLIEEVLVDCGGIISELETAQEFAGVIIDIIDDNTKTGIMDTVDGLLAKQAASLIINDKWEAKYKAFRAEVLRKIDLAKDAVNQQ